MARHRSLWLLVSLLCIALPLPLPLRASGGDESDACPSYAARPGGFWAREAVFYEIFVRSFADSDGDGIGDFRGLRARLDYLNDGASSSGQDLGVTGIWLMPITRSPSYHGYDATDYRRVNEAYGTEADFDELLTAAHQRGIRVIMDLVVNHCSARHPWFEEARRDAKSPHHDWFIWRSDDPGWTQPWSQYGTWHLVRELGAYYYGLFWSGMPDLNYENPAVRREMIDTALYWLGRGVDGFRLDASRHIIEAGEQSKMAGSPETHAWWREFAAAVRERYPQALLVGENWTHISEVAAYFGSAAKDELDMSFDFDLSEALLGAVNEGDPERLGAALCAVSRHYPEHALDGTFLTNHDMTRVMTQLGGDWGKARLAASLLLTLPGVPFLYYGEEIGLSNGPAPDDEDKRRPMQWTAGGGFSSESPWRAYGDDVARVNVAAESGDAASLLAEYRRLIRLRAENPALSAGAYQRRRVLGPDSAHVFAFARRAGAGGGEGESEQRLLIVANLSGEERRDVVVEMAEAGKPGGGDGARALYPKSAASTAVTRALTVSSIPPGDIVAVRF